MYVIVGLGNAEPKYDHTYHNVGFFVIDQLAKEWGISFTKKKFHSLVGEGMYQGEKIYLLKPTTYMNASGIAVQDIVKSLKVKLENLIIIYDDIDLPVGHVRYRQKGSAGTHNGMRSIVSMIGSTEFPRVRVGIGRKEGMDLADFVLSKISKDDQRAIDNTIPEVIDIVQKRIENKI